MFKPGQSRTLKRAVIMASKQQNSHNLVWKLFEANTKVSCTSVSHSLLCNSKYAFISYEQNRYQIPKCKFLLKVSGFCTEG